MKNFLDLIWFRINAPSPVLQFSVYNMLTKTLITENCDVVLNVVFQRY